MIAVARHPWNTAFEWQRPPLAPRRLTTADVDAFDRNGWLAIDGLLDATTLTELTAELDLIEAATAAVVRAQPDSRLVLSETGSVTFAPHIVPRSETARRLSTSTAITDVCHDLLGPEVRLYWDQLVYKHPDRPREFPWHQDNGYAYVEPQQYLTVWIALTDATVDNGCPWVAPGGHRGGTLAHEWIHPLGLRCFDEHPDATPAPVRAGGAVVFSSLTPHRTGPNLTDATRKTYILQYAPDGAEVLHGDPSAGSPERRVVQNDPDRQYLVLSGGDRREVVG